MTQGKKEDNWNTERGGGEEEKCVRSEGLETGRRERGKKRRSRKVKEEKSGNGEREVGAGKRIDSV